MTAHTVAAWVLGRPSPAVPADLGARHPLARPIAWAALAAAATAVLAAGVGIGAELRAGAPALFALGLIAAAATVALLFRALASRAQVALNAASSERDALRSELAALRQSHDRLRHLAYHDTLTGLPNRGLLFDRLGVAVRQAHRRALGVGVLFIDIDDFKAVNDSYGHDAGDRLLVELASRMRDGVRAGDTVARLGGDEFVVLLDGVTGPEDAARVASKVREAVRAPFRHDGRDLAVTASVGVSTYPGDGASPEALLRSADAAMYEAKRRGPGAPAIA